MFFPKSTFNYCFLWFAKGVWYHVEIQSFSIKVCAVACWTCYNFRLWPRSHLKELSKLPLQHLDSPGYHGRCHFEKYDLISCSQYYQTFCRVKPTSHFVIFGTSERMFYWAIIEVFTKSWQWKYVLACCHWYWCRFFGTRVPNKYYIVERCCYMCIFMLPTTHGLQTPSEHHAILGDFFSFSIMQSLEFLHLTQVYIIISFLT